VKKQQICIIFRFKLCKIVGEIKKMLKEASSDNALGLTKTYKWLKHFKMRTDFSQQCGVFWMTFEGNHG
jgi:hypothetical protein